MNCTHIFYDWRVLVVRWLSMPFSKDFLVISFKKSDKDMNDKDQPKHTNHINEPHSSHCLIVHEDAHLSYKWYIVDKFCFKCHQRYTSINIHKHTLFLFFFFQIFFLLFFIFILLKNWTKQTNTHTPHKNTRLTKKQTNMQEEHKVT